MDEKWSKHIAVYEQERAAALSQVVMYEARAREAQTRADALERKIAGMRDAADKHDFPDWALLPEELEAEPAT